MLKKAKRKFKNKKVDTKYPHNPRYSMIVPDADKRDDEDIAPTGQS